ncbi:hypothetical protein BAUCODRAFT_149192 [Baudoinia panamericana UAMH 10762]|uniref:FAS1 domain-containing protein n=1 Tax=Baudoinia panamericana (strain UAMH 10762) TaxID=717646 RepID=M2LLK6_BAUPA|nr:uncharacterized protein BAUCODRAFT_149192 [Baudoinia panamericana UAMH 10762]EMC95172.1 hypothetical protein BAUCODRAFT_149192 [Baudoinia panamericana UAMH 10762]
MRAGILASTVILAAAQAQLVPFLKTPSHPHMDQQQRPLEADAPGNQLPPFPNAASAQGDVILSDVIGNQRQINIFAGFTRDVSSVSTRLETTGLNTTVLAPSNSALSSLPRKPWENPNDYDSLGAAAYEGQAGEDRAGKNLRRFTEAHVVLASPWKEGEKARNMLGSEVWWENKGGMAVVQPGGVEVERVVSRVANGEVWLLKGVLNYAT